MKIKKECEDLLAQIKGVENSKGLDCDCGELIDKFNSLLSDSEIGYYYVQQLKDLHDDLTNYHHEISQPISYCDSN